MNHSWIILEEPLERGPVRMERGPHLRPGEEPALPPVHCLPEAWSVEVKWHSGAGSGQTKGQGGPVPARQAHNQHTHTNILIVRKKRRKKMEIVEL